jgi:hypothetical protein
LQIIEESGLKGVKHLHNLTWPEIINHIKEHFGIVLLGSGAYGQVFSHPSWNYVIKIYESDPGYDRFLKFCSSANSPHLPKVLRAPKVIHQFHTRLPEAGSKLNVVKLEILQPLSSNFTALLSQVRGTHSNKKMAHLYMQFKSNQRDGLYMQISSKYNLDDVFTILSQIEGQMSGDHEFLDIHDSNFMMRGETVVIADPISNLHTSEPWYRHDSYPEWIGVDATIKMKKGVERSSTPKTDDGIWGKLGKLLKGF